jgi:hypothetical protein
MSSDFSGLTVAFVRQAGLARTGIGPDYFMKNLQQIL